MESRPLEYQSLKVVLEHLDANLRFQLSTRIPSIRNVERFVPLKIDRLSSDLLRGLTINNTFYQIGIAKTYPSSKEIPDHVQKMNRSGGLRYDIDHLGFQDYSTQSILEPGDILMPHPFYPEYFENRRIGVQQRKQNPTEFINTKQKEIEREEKIKRAMAGYLHQNPNSLSAKRRKAALYCPTVERIQNEVEPYYHLHDGTLPKYETWIQLTIRPESGESEFKIERVKYNQKLHVAQKYLSNVLFGGRKADIRVKKLELLYSENYVFRFPFGMKLKIRELKVNETKILENEQLMSLIDDLSYPLQQFIIDRTTGGLHFPIIETAQKLIIRGFTMGLSFQDILNLSHKNVTCLRSPLSSQDYFLVIQSWLESNREVETEYIFTEVRNEVADDLLRIISGRIDRVVVVEVRTIVIPINNGAQLKVSCFPSENPSRCSIRMAVTKAIQFDDICF